VVAFDMHWTMRWSELPLAAFLSSVTAATQVAASERTLFLFRIREAKPHEPVAPAV
jgi:hypothetical protein